MNPTRRPDASRGFSILELLAVVGIIGVMVLVATPNFITFYRANQMRTSLRQFNGDVRAARQRAVTRNQRVRVTFEAGAGMRQYEILEWDPVAADWASVAARSLDQVVYIGSTNFTDTEGDSKPDIVFRSNGTVNPYPVNGQVVIQTDANIPKNVWTVSLKETGNLSATSN